MVLKPSTLLHFHHLLTKRKYRRLFSSKHGCRPGPKGPAKESIVIQLDFAKEPPPCSWRIHENQAAIGV
jgi:hypothetical protein